jgi:hypothetical protein
MLTLYIQHKNFNDIGSGAFVGTLLMCCGENAVILELPEDGVNKRQKV